jgi:hypothetical protein
VRGRQGIERRVKGMNKESEGKDKTEKLKKMTGRIDKVASTERERSASLCSEGSIDDYLKKKRGRGKRRGRRGV